MLSGVASDAQVRELAKRFSNGELVRMLSLIQKTAAGFTRSSSRRMDAELCIVNLCQPELVLDSGSLNARLTRLEDRLNSGDFTVKTSSPAVVEDDERPPMPDDSDAPPETGQYDSATQNDAPIGFWTDVAAQIRKELKPPASGFFAPTPNAPVQGVLQGQKLLLVCSNKFTMEYINKPEILDLVSRKASAKLGIPVRAFAVDHMAGSANTEQMEQLLQFGRAHSDIINIKEN